MRILLLLACLALAVPAALQNLPPDHLPAGRFNEPGTFVLANVSVIDGTGAPMLRNQSIVMSGGLIQSIGDAATVKTPDGATILDLRGSTDIPGLVAMHEHI